MKTRFYLVMAMVALSWMGCSQEEDAVNQMQVNGGKTINATIESITRSTVTDAGVFSWTNGDAISLHSNDKCDFYTYNSSQSMFYLNTTSQNVENPRVAYYPGNASHTESKFYLRDTYGVTADGSNYSSYVENTYAAMIATPPTEGNTFEFKHLGGVMRFNVKNVPEGTTEFVFTAVGKRISGLFTVNETEGTIATEDTDDNNEENSVSIKFAELQEPADMTFYVPMPTGTYGNYTVAIKVGSEFKEHKSTGVTNTIKRKSLLLMPTFTFDGGSLIKGTAKVGVIDLEDGNKSADISASADIVVTPGDANATATLNYTPASNGSSELSLSDGTNSATSVESKGQVVVATSENATITSCDINTPSLTVELSAAEGTSVVYNEVTALTAQQTLVIGEGVTINNLVVKGGNVVLKGNVKNIESDVETTITLDEDITLAESIVFNGNNITLDMAGKTITAQGDGIEVVGGTLTITGNGVVNAGQIQTPTDAYVAVWANGGNVIIENGTFTVADDPEGYTNDCIYAKGSAITIKGGTFSNAGIYDSSKGGVVINAHNTLANSKVTINGGTFNPAEGCVPYEQKDVEAGRIELNNPVMNETELKIAVAAGKNVKFGTDITVESTVVVTKDLTIDLNEKTLTSKQDGFEVTAGTLTITGDGTVNAASGDQWVAVWANGGNVVIENGTYFVGADANGYTNDCIYAKGSAITIKGGIFSNAGIYDSSKGGVVINAHNTLANSKVTINGGTFNPAEGCVPYEQKDVEAGRIELNNPVMNETELKIAVAAGKNVKFGTDITVESTVVVTKDLTIDLNGKTLTSKQDGFEVTAGTLTITGNGTVNAGTTGGQWVAVWANGGDVVIENGTYSVVADINNTTNDCIYAKGGQITINGGTFSNVGTYVPGNGGVVINANNDVANSTIIINGGTFNPAEGCVAYEQKDVDARRVIINTNY